MLSSRIDRHAGGERLVELRLRVDFDLEEMGVREAGAHGSHGLCEATGCRHVVVLDHGAVEEPEAVRTAATVDDGLLFEGAQPRRRLAGTGDHGRGAGRFGHVARRERGYAGQTGQEVEAGALESEDAGLPAGQRGQGSAGGKRRAAVERKGDLEIGVDQARGLVKRHGARQHAAGARLDPRPCRAR